MGDSKVVLLRKELSQKSARPSRGRSETKADVAHEFSRSLPLDSNRPVAQLRAIESVDDLLRFFFRRHLEVAVRQCASSGTDREFSLEPECESPNERTHRWRMMWMELITFSGEGRQLGGSQASTSLVVVLKGICWLGPSAWSRSSEATIRLTFSTLTIGHSPSLIW